ncbi:LysM peptidoglycan-binding domain-containing protein [uncultured Winogradskyella sp.]|uniref:LysM peptidoglycan-binding domain-containing protein n=1 Tax=uncultured Winogradskyella sp. TaxID=395353 RepID=UPI0030DB39ED|tara:strand:+ start:13239 stop:13979 length:741 start_codon:yes stop_codon:yes gene_type:complete
MQRNYKLIAVLIFLSVSSLGAYAQDDAAYKDVILDGKPAKLNVATGEITLVASTIKDSVKQKVNKPKRDSIENDNSTSNYHIVKDNETLLDISKQYGVSLTDLKKANNLETTLINTGQQLIIKNLEDNTTKTFNSTIESDVNNGSNFHTVLKDETLYSLAKRYNLDVEVLKNLNDLKSNTIKIGERLRIKRYIAQSTPINVLVLTVKKGDTLYSIAKRNGISIAYLKQLNNLSSNTIFVGQELKIK